jgi:hypothetical protein
MFHSQESTHKLQVIYQQPAAKQLPATCCQAITSKLQAIYQQAASNHQQLAAKQLQF